MQKQMNNSLVWSTQYTQLAAEIFWQLYKCPIILSSFNIEEFKSYQESYEMEHYKFTGACNIDKIWQVKEKSGVEWNLIKPLDKNTFTDFLVACIHVGEFIAVFSNDVSLITIKSWIDCSDRFFIPTAILDYNDEFVIDLCEASIWPGVTEQTGNDDILIISSDQEKLNEIIDFAIKEGELQLPNFTDSLSFKVKCKDKNIIFLTDLKRVIKRIYKDLKNNPWDESSLNFKQRYLNQIKNIKK